MILGSKIDLKVDHDHWSPETALAVEKAVIRCALESTAELAVELLNSGDVTEAANAMEAASNLSKWLKWRFPCLESKP
jgi:hypothetical protein